METYSSKKIFEMSCTPQSAVMEDQYGNVLVRAAWDHQAKAWRIEELPGFFPPFCGPVHIHSDAALERLGALVDQMSRDTGHT